MFKRACVFALTFLFTLVLFAQDKPRETIPVLLEQLRAANTPEARAKLLLTIADAYIMKPGEQKSDMDSALLLINQGVSLNKSVKSKELTGIAYILQAKLFRESGQKEKGKAFAEQALAWATQHRLDVQLAYANNEMGAYYDWQQPSELEIKVKYVQRAADYFGKTGRIEMEARTLEYLGDCLSILGREDDALVALLRSVEQYKAAGLDDLQGVYGLLGSLYTNAADYQLGLRYGLLAVKVMEKRADSSAGWTMVYNAVGLSYFRLSQYRDARQYFEKALYFAEKYHDSASLRLMWGNLAHTYYWLKKPYEALAMLKKAELAAKNDDEDGKVGLANAACLVYIHMGKLDSARMHLARLDNIHRKLPPLHSKQHYFYTCSNKYYEASKQYDKLALYADSMRQYAMKTGRKAEENLAYYYFFLADSVKGNLSSAIRNYQRYVSMRDSLYGDEIEKQIHRVKIEFQTEKKESDIQALQQKQQEKDMLLQEAGLRFKFIIAGSIMLLILLVVLWSRYNIKQKSNRLLQAQKQTIDSKSKAQEKLLEEKEWLIREIHHRVKNNLQIVMSLLNTQSVYLDNEKAREAILQSQHRMYAMSLIHQRLYQTDNLAVIEMRAYVGELVSYLRESLESTGKIHFMIDVDQVQLDAAQAVPIGLILNEAITNSIKYAFPAGRSGVIRVSLTLRNELQLVLHVTDNGVGVPAGTDLLTSNSMGMNLIRILARQLEGQLSFVYENGLSLLVTFPLNEQRSLLINGAVRKVAG